MNTPLNRVTVGSIFHRRLHAAKVTRKEEATETGEKEGQGKDGEDLDIDGCPWLAARARNGFAISELGTISGLTS